MKIVVVYRDETDYAREVTDYLRDFERQTGHALETLNPDTPAGIDFCNTYDIVQCPTVVTTSDDGVMQNLWQGLPLPTINELSYYIQ
jgi:hypothetical protein